MPAGADISRRRSLVRFGIVTVITFALSFGLTILLHEVAGAPEELAYAVALATVFCTSFAFLRWYIYGRRTGPIVPQFFWYGLSALGFRGSEYLAFLVLHTWLDTPYILAMLVIQGASFVAKFLYYGAVVFRRPRTPDATPIAETPGTGPEPPTP